MNEVPQDQEGKKERGEIPATEDQKGYKGKKVSQVWTEQLVYKAPQVHLDLRGLRNFQILMKPSWAQGSTPAWDGQAAPGRRERSAPKGPPASKGTRACPGRRETAGKQGPRATKEIGDTKDLLVSKASRANRAAQELMVRRAYLEPTGGLPSKEKRVTPDHQEAPVPRDHPGLP